jgi:hypothetical protein
MVKYKQYLKCTFLRTSVRKQHIKIKIINYLRLIKEYNTTECGETFLLLP